MRRHRMLGADMAFTTYGQRRTPLLYGAAGDVVVGWAGTQGRDWAARNPGTVVELDRSYLERFGMSRSSVNAWALVGIPHGTRVLEVGCSRGTQLDALAAAGWTDLEGCDVCAEAVAQCHWPAQVADGCALPYPDAAFDMVLTSGTWMHVPPERRGIFATELARVARGYIYGVEAVADEPCVYEFGGLIPRAWMEPLPDAFLAHLAGWQTVRTAQLRPLDGQGIPLAVYLLGRTTTAET